MIYIACIGALFAATVWVALHNAKIDLSKSLSIHIGKSKQSISCARLSFPVISVLLLWWFFASFAALRMMPFDIVVGMSIFAATIAIQGLFPYGQRHTWDRIHDVSAWTAACLGPALLLRFAWVIEGPTHIPLLICGITSMTILAALLLVRPVRKYFLILQLSMVAISGVCFALLAMVY